MPDPVVEALLREREGYVARGRDDRVALVDAALARFGHRADAPEAAVVSPPENAAKPKPRARRSSQ